MEQAPGDWIRFELIDFQPSVNLTKPSSFINDDAQNKLERSYIERILSLKRTQKAKATVRCVYRYNLSSVKSYNLLFPSNYSHK
jgi:hypothetical protein